MRDTGLNFSQESINFRLAVPESYYHTRDGKPPQTSVIWLRPMICTGEREKRSLQTHCQRESLQQDIQANTPEPSSHSCRFRHSTFDSTKATMALKIWSLSLTRLLLPPLC